MQFSVKVRLLDGSLAKVATITVEACGSGHAAFMDVDGFPAQVTPAFETEALVEAFIEDGGIEIIIINDDGM